jgi:hypothetical protein
VWVALGLVGCGAPHAASTAESSGGEVVCEARAELARSETELADCRATRSEEPGWPAHAHFDALVPRLAAHVASLSPARSVSSEEVQPLAEGIWELLDQVALPESESAVRDRAETAAEALLRDRDAEHAGAAAAEALDAVNAVATAAAPPTPADPCTAIAARVDAARAQASRCTP